MVDEQVADMGLPVISAATLPGRNADRFAEMKHIVLDPSGQPPSMQMPAGATAMFQRDWLLLTERRDKNGSPGGQPRLGRAVPTNRWVEG